MTIYSNNFWRKNNKKEFSGTSQVIAVSILLFIIIGWVALIV
jgi:hypothetical protein